MSKEYNSPEILDEFTNSEPVETGCCLRSCGGSPHHIKGQSQLSKEADIRFKEALDE